jgi:hypothetical protein
MRHTKLCKIISLLKKTTREKDVPVFGLSARELN